MKERLVGAAILVGLIVVLVPEMLSGPKDSETAGIVNDDGSVRTYTIDLSAPGKTTEAQEPKPQPEFPEPQPLQRPATPEKTPEVVIAEPETATASQVEVKPETKPEPEVKPPPKPQPTVEVSKPEAKPVAPVSKPAAAPTSGWSVQLGSFANADNAKKLAATVKAKGYPAFVSTTGSGAKARHRTRVGPVDSRAEADKLAQRLKKDGHSGAVVSN